MYARLEMQRRHRIAALRAESEARVCACVRAFIVNVCVRVRLCVCMYTCVCVFLSIET
jgi:hypothetical protein